jgi:hypothetical protein
MLIEFDSILFFPIYLVRLYLNIFKKLNKDIFRNKSNVIQWSQLIFQIE